MVDCPPTRSKRGRVGGLSPCRGSPTCGITGGRGCTSAPVAPNAMSSETSSATPRSPPRAANAERLRHAIKAHPAQCALRQIGRPLRVSPVMSVPTPMMLIQLSARDVAPIGVDTGQRPSPVRTERPPNATCSDPPCRRIRSSAGAQTAVRVRASAMSSLAIVRREPADQANRSSRRPTSRDCSAMRSRVRWRRRDRSPRGAITPPAVPGRLDS